LFKARNNAKCHESSELWWLAGAGIYWFVETLQDRRYSSGRMRKFQLELDDWGTRQKITDLSFKNNRLSGAYLSFDAFEDILNFKNGNWFAAPGIDVGDFVAIEISEDFGEHFSKKPLAPLSPYRAIEPSDKRIDATHFWEINYDFIKALGITYCKPPGLFEDDSPEGACADFLTDFFLENPIPRFVKTIFYSHDNFIFSIFSSDEPVMVQNVIKRVTEVHWNYSNCDADVRWAPAG
jgi:hypothetical protein